MIPVVDALLAGHGHVDFSTFTAVEWVLFVGSAALVAWSIWRAVVLTVHPGEEEPDHIKRSILLKQRSLDVAVSLRAPDRSGRGSGGGGTP